MNDLENDTCLTQLSEQIIRSSEGQERRNGAVRQIQKLITDFEEKEAQKAKEEKGEKPKKEDPSSLTNEDSRYKPSLYEI